MIEGGKVLDFYTDEGNRLGFKRLLIPLARFAELLGLVNEFGRAHGTPPGSVEMTIEYIDSVDDFKAVDIQVDVNDLEIPNLHTGSNS